VDGAVKLATWNVNSLGARMPRVLEFLGQQAPDVLCLQETKVEAAAFPADVLAQAGYVAAHHSAGRWAGVAILARDGFELTDVRAGLPGEPVPEEARWVEATVGGVLRVASVYVVNGRAVDSEWFAQKLTMLDAMAQRAAALRAAGLPLLVTGDFNVAPADLDVYDTAAFAGSTHVTPAERDRLASIMAAGDLVDAYRVLHPEEVGYTWWDYRQGHFHRKLGLRIDLALVSASLASAVTDCGIRRDFRKGTKPSDHAPLVVEIAGL